jgi:hypothetical protein
MFRAAPLVVFLFALSACSFSFAQADKPDPKTTYTDPEKADADFAVQGEYRGKLATDDGMVDYGLQAVARGGGKFLAVVYKGGLPGDGWDRDEPLRVDGKRADKTVIFQGDDGKGVWEEGLITVSHGDGQVMGKLERVVRKSPTLGAKPPQGATVLFDGTSVDAFEGASLTDDGCLRVPGTSKQKFKSCQLHLEFMTPYMPYAEGQARGNSGVYLQGRYEVQVLDSFGLEGKWNECGGIYEHYPPKVNMCFPPLAWQTYDIDFSAASFEGSKKLKSARMSVKHNGVLIHDDVEIGETTRAAPVALGADAGPLYLQDHSNPVIYRNIWVLSKD